MRHSNGMVRRSPLLTVVLTLLLVMQWGGAFAHCIGALGATQAVESIFGVAFPKGTMRGIPIG